MTYKNRVIALAVGVPILAAAFFFLGQYLSNSFGWVPPTQEATVTETTDAATDHTIETGSTEAAADNDTSSGEFDGVVGSTAESAYLEAQQAKAENSISADGSLASSLPGVESSKAEEKTEAADTSGSDSDNTTGKSSGSTGTKSSSSGSKSSSGSDPSSSTPKTGVKNEKGEYYVPGFGYIAPGQGVGETVGSSDDELTGEKVGSMN